MQGRVAYLSVAVSTRAPSSSLPCTTSIARFWWRLTPSGSVGTGNVLAQLLQGDSSAEITEVYDSCCKFFGKSWPCGLPVRAGGSFAAVAGWRGELLKELGRESPDWVQQRFVEQISSVGDVPVVMQFEFQQSKVFVLIVPKGPQRSHRCCSWVMFCAVLRGGLVVDAASSSSSGTVGGASIQFMDRVH